MKRILVIQTAFIGDVILATPLIEKLGKFFPRLEIDVMVRKGNETLLENNPHIHELIIWDKKTHKIKNLWNILKKTRKKRYDILINLQRFTSTGLFTIFSRAQYTIGFKKNPFSFLFSFRANHEIGSGKHEVERNISLIEHITDDEFVRPMLYPSKNDFYAVTEYKLHPYICIAPTSVWFTKQFPADQWIELIRHYIPNYKVYLLGGPNDEEACDEIKDEFQDSNIVNLAGKLSFLQTAALMKNAIRNFVNDSAPLHIASAMNAQTTAVFCSTIPDFGFGPLSENSTVVETSLDLKCRPCGLHGHAKCPEGHFKCAKSIRLEQLTENINYD